MCNAYLGAEIKASYIILNINYTARVYNAQYLDHAILRSDTIIRRRGNSERQKLTNKGSNNGEMED